MFRNGVNKTPKMQLVIAFISTLVCASGASTNNWRIVGGFNADEGQFPYQISLRYGGSHSCGGSILDNKTILCAAHCVSGRSSSKMTIATGSNKLNSGGDVYEVDSFIAHEDYNPKKVINDISIIKLKDAIIFNENVLPVKLRVTDVAGDEKCMLSGWGRTTYPGTVPNDLQWIELKTVPNDDCKAKQNNIVDSEICTLTKAGEGACQGDSGGPLVDENKEQIGVVSWGTPCARGKPDVFTRVFSFLDWIQENR